MPDAIAAGCERLVHGRVDDAGTRALHARLIGAGLAAPFLFAASAVMLATASRGVSATLAAILTIFGLFWLAALWVSATGRAGPAAAAVLAIGAPGLGLLIAFAGGLASPAALLLAAFPAEAWWAGRSRRWLLAGAGGAALACAVAALLPGVMTMPAGMQPAAWHWLPPLAWAAIFAARMAGLRKTDEQRTADAEPAADIEALADVVLLRLDRQGEVLDAGAHARAVLGLDPDLLIGSALFDRVHVTDRIAYLNALADMRDGAVAAHADIRLRLPRAAEAAGDNYRSFRLDLARAGDEGSFFFALLNDVSEIAGLRRALARAEEIAAGAEAAKSRFLAAVAHELRTPLNAIIGFSDVLLHEMFGPLNDPRQKEYVGLMRDSGEHLLDVVNSILDVSRIEAGAYRTLPAPFRFMEAAEMCRAMMQLQADAREVRLDLRVATDAGELVADRRAIRQILINLVGNAVKFTPAGGEVTIGARRIGSRLHFWVADTGIGMAEDDLARIGQPFVRGRNSSTDDTQGAGLGLSLVKGLVSLHDGTMSIDSAPGKGTTVTVSIPVDGAKGEVEGEMEPADAVPEAGDKGEWNGALRKTG